MVGTMELGLFVGFVALFVVLWISIGTVLWPVSVLFYGSYYYDKGESDGRARYFRPAARKTFLGPTLQWLFRFRLETEGAQPIPPGPVIFACRPHGILSVSVWLTFLLEGYRPPPHRRVLLAVHSFWFTVPGVRELALLFGCIDVGYESIVNALAHGFSVAVLPGGIREMGPPVVPLPEKPGIVKIAEELHVPIVPVFFAGEPGLFWLWHTEPQVIGECRACCIRCCRLPFPLLCFPRCCWHRPRLATVFGRALVAHSPLDGTEPLAVRLKKAEERLQNFFA